MDPENEKQSVSPQLKRLQTPKQNSIRSFFRVVGPLVLALGVICTIGGGVSFFSAFGGSEPPRYFWLGFIGLPLMFVGGVLSQFGFMGAMERYVAGESAPVAADTINYMADETKGPVETVTKAAAKGIVEGIEAGKVTGATHFCPYCGCPTKGEFKFCPKCGKSLATA